MNEESDAELEALRQRIEEQLLGCVVHDAKELIPDLLVRYPEIAEAKVIDRTLHLRMKPPQEQITLRIVEAIE